MSQQRKASRKTVVSKPELQRLLTDLPFVRSYGFRVRSIAPGECVLAVPFQPAFERPGGIVSGLVFMAAADVGMWLAIKTLLGSDDGCVTAEMKTSFLAAAKQQDFQCHAKILKLGRRLVYGVAECVSPDGKLLTHHTLTYIRPERNTSGRQQNHG
jgi:acyl-coenzyme A thioesterase PaaI-like protein